MIHTISNYKQMMMKKMYTQKGVPPSVLKHLDSAQTLDLTAPLDQWKIHCV